MKINQAKHLLVTDFELIKRSMQIGLTPLQLRIIQYLSSCWAHESIAEMGKTAEWIGISQKELDRELGAIALNPGYLELESYIYR